MRTNSVPHIQHYKYQKQNLPYLFDKTSGISQGRCQISHSIKRDYLTQWVFSTIQADMENGTFLLNIRQPLQTVDPANLLQGQIDREQMKLVRVREAYEAGIDTLEEYRHNKEKLTATIQQLQEELKTILSHTNSDLLDDGRLRLTDKVRALLPELTSQNTPEDEKNRLMRSFIEKIVFDRKETSIEIFYYL